MSVKTYDWTLWYIVGEPNTGKTVTVGVFRERGHYILHETATTIIEQGF